MITPVDTRFSEADAARILGKVEASDCWEWLAGKSSGGYGYTSVRDWSLPAHRAVWHILVGEIPDGLQLDHLCRNRGCVNPDHLEPVTQQENIKRGSVSALRRQFYAGATHCRRGHERTADNGYINGVGAWTCRPCRRIAERNRKEARQ